MKNKLENLFDYDPVSGELLWKVAPDCHGKVARAAGAKHHTGYIKVRIDGKQYSAHRLIWIMHNGNIPDGLQIDHINGIRDDNRIGNLRLATRNINCQNQHLAHNHNKSGLLGVCKQYGKFKARIEIDGKRRHLGTFFTPEEAHSAYLKAKRDHHPGCTI
jgi:hypothetical protein